MIIITVDAIDVTDAVDADEIDKLCKPLHSAQSKVKINFIV